jgi:Bacterial Ig-like domain
MPADRPSSTGGLTVGRYVMDVGAPEGMIVRRVRMRGTPPPELVEALAEEEPPVAAVEEAIEDANEVAGRIDRAATLFTKVARGELDVATIAGELEGLLDLLRRLDGGGRYREALRLARVLARLLALAARLAALVQTLRIAVHAAEALADSKALAWALHKLGTLALGAGDAEAAERDLGEARRLREQAGDEAGLAATEHNLSYVGAGALSSRVLRVGGGALVLAVVLVLVFVAIPDDDDDNNGEPTPSPTATDTGPDDGTAPQPTLAADALSNERAPTLEGTAGTDGGDNRDVAVRIYGGTEVSGDPLQDLSATRGGDGRFQLQAAPLESGTYTAQAEQGDAAGNVGRSDPVTFTLDLEPPAVAIGSPPDAATTDESPSFSGTAGTAEGDQPVLTLSTPATAQSIAVQPGGTWEGVLAVPAVQDPDSDPDNPDYLPVTATAEQSDEAGNVGTATVTFTPEPPGVDR